ncbi:MAG: hypothetical protein DMG46_00430 [Acidobacteria bacterium]|nr:MAG: hypothetical protein DMG46_00430 [Acidobacteriota bacterium]
MLFNFGIQANTATLDHKPTLKKEPQRWPADTHQRKSSANVATRKDSTATRTNHQRTGAHVRLP